MLASNRSSQIGHGIVFSLSGFLSTLPIISSLNRSSITSLLKFSSSSVFTSSSSKSSSIKMISSSPENPFESRISCLITNCRSLAFNRLRFGPEPPPRVLPLPEKSFSGENLPFVSSISLNPVTLGRGFVDFLLLGFVFLDGEELIVRILAGSFGPAGFAITVVVGFVTTNVPPPRFIVVAPPVFVVFCM
uniref:CSON000057 protein n=1 Tax=Culicoides sonorensis TaxID=179676 RepID=A0A336MHM8_CULSO